MNTDVFEGRWKQMRGELRSWWGKLTDDDLEKIGGKRDRLVGVLQEKYGYTREAAQQEIDRRFREYDKRPGASSPGRAGQATSSTAQAQGATVDETTAKAKGAAEEAAAAAASTAAQSVSAVGEKIGSLADVIREKAPHEGAMGTAATTVANKLGAAGSYLQQKNMDHMVGDLTGMIRRYPIPALLIGLGIGYLLAGRARR
ncbi:MAG TPA: CsbD family protein [Candidatus Tectomicrobia bacterium]|jgi:uncharacterized protein YjbJ (UPF0337 family)|nr:CsbD family protein [Candidatus Tectomicrobia bacterium]